MVDFQKPLYFLVCIIFGLTAALELKDAEEGICLRNVPYHQDVEPSFMDSLPYISGGSKYYLYRQASVHPQFGRMRDFQFYYGACMVKNTSYDEGNASVFGFGRLLGSYEASVAAPGVGLFIPSNPESGPRSDYYTVRVTLTDYRTFVVLLECWEGADQRSFTVLSLTPRLDKETEKLIEEHVVSLKFRRENVVFLRYNDCKNLEKFLSNTGRDEPSGNMLDAVNDGRPHIAAGNHPRRSLKNNRFSVGSAMSLKTTTTTRSPHIGRTTRVPPTGKKVIYTGSGNGSWGGRTLKTVGMEWTGEP